MRTTDPDTLRWTMLDIEIIELQKKLESTPAEYVHTRELIEIRLRKVKKHADALARDIISCFAAHRPQETEKPSNNLPDIILPWPDPRLSPNARIHWASKAKAASRARELAGFSALAQGWSAHSTTALPSDAYLHLWIDFYPPTRRHRDDDNLLSCFKPYRDGLADALKINDMRFVSHPRIHPEPVKGGQVKVRLTPKHAPQENVP